DVASARACEEVLDGEDPLLVRTLAARLRTRAVQRRLHRRARHAVEMRHAGEGQRYDEEEDEDGQRDHDAEDAECTDPERPPDTHRYWIETRDGGQYVAITLPIRFLRGTVPHRRESHDPLRLSPI